MDSLRTAMHARLSQRNLTEQSLGAFLLHCLKSYGTYPQTMHCVIKSATLHWYVDDREDSLELHHRRVQILQECKEQCIEHWFDQKLVESISSLRVRSATQLQRA